ncbi:MAG: phosphopyruvate hydratase [Burkholderiales bacterium]|nr:phosphopyruvate hydratase [Burkholderiales bacterium]
MNEQPGCGDTRIRQILARRVWDSRGRPTVEAEMHLLGGAVGRAIVPAGASKGRREALELRDGGGRFGGLDVQTALGHIRGEIARALIGMDGADQAALDARLVELDGTAAKQRLGANATLAVSMAAAHAAAAARGLPLYEHLGRNTSTPATLLPMPQIQIFGGGAHAARRVDIQDFMVVCPGASCFAEALEWTAEVYRAAGEAMRERGALFGVADEGGWWPDFGSNEEALGALVAAIERAGYAPGTQVAIALDIAASEFGHGGSGGRAGRYTLGLERRELDSDGFAELLQRWCERYPIASIEDPLAEDDLEGFARFTRALGHRVQIVGDDLLVSDAALVRQAAAAGAANTVLLKPNQRGTLSETLQAWQAARELGYAAIVSARSGETEDTTIVELAIGWGVGQLKVGSFARGERMAKWNEALRIEERLGARARFAGAGVFGRNPAAPRG